MSAFSQKGLEALNQAWIQNEQDKYQAEREAAIAEAAGDQYQLAESYQKYANADANQHNLMHAYPPAEQAAQQQQNVPQPMSEGEKLQRDIWDQIRTGNAQVDTYLTTRWKQGEAVARGQARPEQFETGGSGRTTRRR